MTARTPMRRSVVRVALATALVLLVPLIALVPRRYRALAFAACAIAAGVASQLLTQADGSSNISVQDFAVAMIDELETPAHSRRRFTVGY